jgi:hypothetical protein
LPKWSADYSSRPPLPADVSLNYSAARDDPFFVTLRLESGEKLLFAVDTGMPFTVLDKSLESKLGNRLATSQENYSWFGKRTVGVYETPKLYLNNTRLLISDRILTDDLSKMLVTGHRMMGILGLDCLRHYCIRLDFDARKICFLDPDHLKTNGLGKAFPITISGGAAFVRANFFELKNPTFKIDTGCTLDGALKTEFFEKELKQNKAVVITEMKTAAGVPLRIAYFEKIAFDGNVDRHVILMESDDDNLLGLWFVGRYLTTLNFPKQIMYLKPNALEY